MAAAFLPRAPRRAHWVLSFFVLSWQLRFALQRCPPAVWLAGGQSFSDGRFPELVLARQRYHASQQPHVTATACKQTPRQCVLLLFQKQQRATQGAEGAPALGRRLCSPLGTSARALQRRAGPKIGGGGCNNKTAGVGGKLAACIGAREGRAAQEGPRMSSPRGRPRQRPGVTHFRARDDSFTTTRWQT